MALFITAAVSTTAMLVAYGRMTNLMAAGLGARYEVHIDRNTQRVSAHDRRNRATLWESPYDPNELHLGHTRMRSRHGSYLQPVLVYGDVQQDIIKRGIPTPRQTILTIATQIEIKRLMKRLGQGSENVIKQEPSSTPPSNQSAGGGLLIAMAAVFGTILAAMLLGRKRKE
jgi:hypothetical protein